MSLSFLIPSRTVLLLSDESLAIYDVTQKGVHLRETVSWEADNFEQNVAAIISRDCKGNQVLVLNNMVEQHYRKERVLRGAVGLIDRASMIARKAAATFPMHDVRGAYKLNEKPPASGGAPSDLYIFAGVDATDPVRKTIGAVRDSLAFISGFSLLPVESSSMVSKLGESLAVRRKRRVRSEWTLLIAQHQNGGLRQIVTRNGDLALTRMTPVGHEDTDPDLWSNEVYQEFQATMSYLSRFGYSEEDGLDVIVVADKTLGGLFESQISNVTNYDTLTVQEAATILDLPVGANQSTHYADILHVAWATRRLAPVMSMSSKAISSVVRPRQMAFAAGFLLSVSAIFLIFQFLSFSQSLAQNQASLKTVQKQKAQLDVQYQKEVQRKEALGVDVKLLQAALDTYGALESYRMAPLSLFPKIDRVLGTDLNAEYIEFKRAKPSIEGKSRKRRSSGEEGDPVYEGYLQIRYPVSIDIDVGNRDVDKVVKNLQGALPDHKIEVSKYLKDYSYTEDVVVETGSSGSDPDGLDYVARIHVQGPVKQ